MSYAVGVKVNLEMTEEPLVKEYFSGKSNYILDLQNGEKVTILKGDTKVRNEKAVLIFRYQLIMDENVGFKL